MNESPIDEKLEVSPEGLIALRQSILDALVPLMDSDQLEPDERVKLVMRLAQAKGTLELYQKAFKLIETVRSPDDKLSHYMTLLEDVEFEIDNAGNITESVENTPVPAQPQQNDQHPEDVNQI